VSLIEQQCWSIPCSILVVSGNGCLPNGAIASKLNIVLYGLTFDTFVCGKRGICIRTFQFRYEHFVLGSFSTSVSGTS
jgi:hypothetical protein